MAKPIQYMPASLAAMLPFLESSRNDTIFRGQLVIFLLFLNKYLEQVYYEGYLRQKLKNLKYLSILNVFTTNSITFKGEDEAIAKGIFAFCNCSNKGQMPSIGLRLWSTIYF